MRIAHFIPSLRRGGSERMAVQIARYQHDAGHEVHMVVFSDMNEWQSELGGIVVHQFPDLQVERRRFRKPRVEGDRKFKEWYVRYKPDAIHSHAVWTDVIRFLLLPRNMSRIQISHLHLYHPLLFDISVSAPDRKWLFKQYLQSRTQLIAVSQDQLQKAQETWPIETHSQLHLIQNGVEIPEEDPAPTHPKNPLNVLVVSSLETHKNVDAALHVFEVAQRDRSDLRLQIAGDGSRLEVLQELSRKLGVSGKVEFLGAVQDMRAVYGSARVYLHVSREETFGLAPLEAMAHGVPVIAQYPSVSYLKDQHNALLAPTPEYDLCAGLLKRVLSDPDLKYALIRNGRQTAKRFDIQNSLQDISLLYEKCDTL